MNKPTSQEPGGHDSNSDEIIALKAKISTIEALNGTLLRAALNTISYYASTQPGSTCLQDELNPCYLETETRGLLHWGGGFGCPLCSARAAIAKAQGGA